MVAGQLSDAIATGDVDTLRSLIAADVLIFESGGAETSLAEYEGHHMPADMAFMKSMDRELLSQRVIESGDSAIVVTRSRVRGMYKEKEIDLSSTETLVMKKEGGDWKVVHIHWSSG
jgi:ketosteroid isomerase-like protein